MGQFTIVLGYDGTRTASEALRLAIFHARHFDGFIHVVYSVAEGQKGCIEERDAVQGFLGHAEGNLKEYHILSEIYLLVREQPTGKDDGSIFPRLQCN